MAPDIPRRFSKRLKRKEAARYLGISERQLDKICASGKGPPSVRIGRNRLFDTLELDIFLSLHTEGAD